MENTLREAIPRGATSHSKSTTLDQGSPDTRDINNKAEGRADDEEIGLRIKSVRCLGQGQVEIWIHGRDFELNMRGDGEPV